MQVANKSGIRMGSGIAMNTTVDAGATHEVLNMESPYKTVKELASCNAVVVFSMSGCCMCTVAKRLLFGLGVGPTIIELDEHPAGHDIQAVLYDLLPDGQQSIPAIFIGGKFLGGIETLMAFHINGSLVPDLKKAGALWL